MDIQRLPYNFAKRYGVALIPTPQPPFKILHCKPLTFSVFSEICRYVEAPVFLELTDQESFETFLANQYQNANPNNIQMVDEIREELNLDELAMQLPKPQDLLETQDDAPIIKLVNAILTQAVKNKASDIHIETYEERVAVRFRIDGVLREILVLPRALGPLFISRIKVMAKLDIAEKRLPQDGRIQLRIAGHTVDVRTSTLPSNHGERVVLRLLDKKVARLELKHLGLHHETLEVIELWLKQSNGIILVTGPTGAGKTTSLYAMLNKLNTVSRNILTVEDPIEYDLPGIGQTQVNTKIDMTFAKGLRAILRQDPDVVMVGEIRDAETAEIAVQASLTGHLVLSTLHTNSAVGAVTRLRDMGVEPFLLASSLIGLMAQRLIRLLCVSCKEAHEPLPSEIQLLEKYVKLPAVFQLYKAKGCELCQETGYAGRVGIYECLFLDETMKRMIYENASESTLAEYAHQHFSSLPQDGWKRVVTGETSIEEILRVTTH